MRLFSVRKDGGPESTVTGFFLIEIKSLFSIVLLKFNPGHRENYHSHAFNALSWFLYGEVEEQLVDGNKKIWKPSIIPKITLRSCFHRIFSKNNTYCFTVRGPWKDTWEEYNPNKKSTITLTHERKVISETT